MGQARGRNRLSGTAVLVPRQHVGLEKVTEGALFVVPGHEPVLLLEQTLTALDADTDEFEYVIVIHPRKVIEFLALPTTIVCLEPGKF